MAAPLYPKIEINSGAKVSSSKLLNITLFAVGATEMIIDTTASFSNSNWQPFRSVIQFAVSIDLGNVVLYAKFRSATKDVTPLVSASIKIDTSQPEIISLVIEGGSTGIIKTRNIYMRIEARGISQMKILGDITNPFSEWTDYKNNVSLVLTNLEGEKSIHVYGRNDALDETRKSITIKYETVADVEPPLIDNVTGFQINNNKVDPTKLITYVPDVIINMNVTGATFMQVSEDSTFKDAIWEPYIKTKLFTLSSGYGTKFVYGRFKDNVGNEATADAYIDYLQNPAEVQDFAIFYANPLNLFTIRYAFNRPVNVLGTSSKTSVLNIDNYKLTEVLSGDVLEVKSIDRIEGTDQIFVMRTGQQNNVKYKLEVFNVVDTLGATILEGDNTIEFYGCKKLNTPPIPPTIVSIIYEDLQTTPIVSWIFNTATSRTTSVLIGKQDDEYISTSSLGNKKFQLQKNKMVSKYGNVAIATSGTYQQFTEGRVDFAVRGTDARVIAVDTIEGTITFSDDLTDEDITSGIYVSYHYQFEKEEIGILESNDEQTAFQVQIYDNNDNLIIDSGPVESDISYWGVQYNRRLEKGNTYYFFVRTMNVEQTWSAYCSPRRYDIPSRDAVKPEAYYAYSVLDQNVNIVFSEVLNSEFAEAVDNYYIQGLEVMRATLLTDRKTVALTTTPQNTITYKLVIYGIEDLEGNIMDVTTLKFLGSSYASEIPLYLSYARALNERAVEVVYNKPVRKDSAELVSNYRIVGLEIVGATLIVESQHEGMDIGKRVVLSTSEQAEQTYVLVVINVEDAYGKPIIENNAIDFLGKSIDVITSDLMVIDAASINNSQVEVKFNKPIDYQNSELVSNYFIKGLSIRNAVYQPDGQTVILTTSSQEGLYYSLVVTNIMDRYGNVIKDTRNTAVFKGTSLSDITGPYLVKVVSKDPTHIDVVYNEPMDEFSSTNIANYKITKNLNVIAASLLPNRRIVSLIVSPQELTEYALTVDLSVKDVAGNHIQEGRRVCLFTANLLGFGVDPSLFPAPGVRSSKNSTWWMVVRENETGEILLSEGDIRFCDFDQLPILMQQDKSWIPVLFFGASGEFISVDPATPYSVVSTSGNDLQVVNRYGGIQTLNEHVNDETLHQIRHLAFPYVANVTDLKVQKEALIIDIISDKLDTVGMRSIIVNGRGTALIGTSSVELFDVDSIPLGVGLYVNGDGADMVLNSGKLSTIAIEDSIICGSHEVENSVYVTANEPENAAIEVINDKSVTTVDYDNITLNPVGILGGLLPNTRFGVAGVSNNYIGIIAKGQEADLYLAHGTITSWDLREAELVVDGVKLTANGKYAP